MERGVRTDPGGVHPELPLGAASNFVIRQPKLRGSIMRATLVVNSAESSHRHLSTIDANAMCRAALAARHALRRYMYIRVGVGEFTGRPVPADRVAQGFYDRPACLLTNRPPGPLNPLD